MKPLDPKPKTPNPKTSSHDVENALTAPLAPKGRWGAVPGLAGLMLKETTGGEFRVYRASIRLP